MRACMVCCLVLCSFHAVSAEEGGTIEGSLVTPKGEAVTDATLTLDGVFRRIEADPQGRFRFEDVPPGSHLIRVDSPRDGNAVRSLGLVAGETVTLQIVLDTRVHREDVVVTAGRRSSSEVYEPATVVTDTDLMAQVQASLGDTLDATPGVSSTSFGPGAGRPVIRGLGAGNVRVLEGGVDVGDASSISPDHAVSIDPLSAERIEVLRGPATLLYGGGAVGGVVNVIDERIPTYLPQEPLTGTLDLRVGSVSDERTGGFGLTGRAGKIGIHADFLRRETGDTEIPDGVLDNSSLESETKTFGLSWVGEDGFIGAALRTFDTDYGIPAEEARIELEQQRLDFHAARKTPLGPFSGIDVRLGATDYRHVELEGDEVGTTFLNDQWEGRVEASHRPRGRWSGSFGVQAGNRDFEAIGDEAFVPPNETDLAALFLLEEIEVSEAHCFKVGARFEEQTVQADAGPEIDHEGISVSGGWLWSPAEAWSLAVSAGRSTRMPTAEELLSDGPHVATQSYEIGDPALFEETGTNLDVSLRRREGRVQGELNLFVNRLDDHIFARPTGATTDGLPVFRFVQEDAEFAGAEVQVHIELIHREPHHLELELGADVVRAEVRADGEPLPFIPPYSGQLALHYRSRRFSASVEVARHDDQDRRAPFETPTEGYTLIQARAGVRLFAEGLVHDLMLIGRNLGDEEGRNHVSRLKDQVLLPGRDLSLAYRLRF